MSSMSSTFAVNIALIENYKPIIGIIYAPVSHDIYFAAKGIGSFKIPQHDLIYELTKKNIPENRVKELREAFWLAANDPEYIKEAMKIEFNMTFDDILMDERILMFNVDRNEDDILRIEQKVEKAREFLNQLEQLHKNFNDVKS